MKDLTLKQKLAIRCPTCGAAPGTRCELSAGGTRNSSHRERKMTAADAASGRNDHPIGRAKLKRNTK